MLKQSIPNQSQYRLSHRIWLYAFAVSFATFMLTSACLITINYYHHKNELLNQFEKHAQKLSLVASDAIKTQNRSNLKKLIQAHTQSGELESIHIYDADGNLFAFAKDNPFSQKISPMTNASQVVKTIIDGHQVLGMLAVNGNFAALYKHLTHQILLMVGIFVLGFGLVYWLTRRLSDEIALPFDTINETLDKVIQTYDYTLRADCYNNTSLGGIVLRFNQVLEDIDHKTYALKHSQERLHLALWGSNEILFDWDLESDMLYFDDAIEQLLGFTQAQVPTTVEQYLHAVHPSDLEAFQDALGKHLKEEVAFFESEHRIKDSQDYRWILTRGKVVERDEKGNPKRLIGTLGDIETRKASETELQLFHEVFSNTTEAIVVTDNQLRIIQCNQAFTTITGHALEEVQGMTLELLYSDEHPPAYFNHIRNSIETNHTWTGEITQRRKSGQTYPTYISMNAIPDENGQTVHYVCVFNDRTQEQLKEDKLKYLTHFDSLTGLYNREQIKQTIEHHIHLANEAKESFGVLVVGIDSFKAINDTYGNGVGDKILIEVANRLKRQVKNTKLLARLGGDEFAILVPNMSHRENLESLAQTIIQSVSSMLEIDDIDLSLGCCVGLSVYPHDGQDMDTMLINADTAMMQAKKSHRNSYQFFTRSMNQQVSEKQKLESMIRKAIDNQEFELYYQPKIDTQTGRIAGAEALMRWHSSQMGLVSPDKFIPIAEESGLILALGQWALEQACRQAQYWTMLGWQDFSVAVNVSAIQFKQKDFIDNIASVLHETGLNPNQLELEITEGAIMDDMDYCIEVLQKLKAARIKIAIDDFGTGYSSLSYIKQFPIDVLKIDKAFVVKMDSSSEDSHIVAAILSMARGLNFNTVAEGVESQEQADQLKALGCDYIQGFYYSRAVTAANFENCYAKFNQSPFSSHSQDAS